MIMIILSINL